jgi:hypothetical protein
MYAHRTSRNSTIFPYRNDDFLGIHFAEFSELSTSVRNYDVYFSAYRSLILYRYLSTDDGDEHRPGDEGEAVDQDQGALGREP